MVNDLMLWLHMQEVHLAHLIGFDLTVRLEDFFTGAVIVVLTFFTTLLIVAVASKGSEPTDLRSVDVWIVNEGGFRRTYFKQPKSVSEWYKYLFTSIFLWATRFRGRWYRQNARRLDIGFKIFAVIFWILVIICILLVVDVIHPYE